MNADTVWLNRKWKNPRWRPPNFKCMYLRFQTRYQQNSDGYTNFFWVQHSNGTRSKTVQPNRKWIIQNGGLQTSNACIFASRLDINEIPTAMPMFSGFSFPLGLIIWLCDQTCRGKIQDGGWHYIIVCFSAPRQVSDKIPTAKPMFFGSSIPT